MAVYFPSFLSGKDRASPRRQSLHQGSGSAFLWGWEMVVASGRCSPLDTSSAPVAPSWKWPATSLVLE